MQLIALVFYFFAGDGNERQLSPAFSEPIAGA